MDNGFTFNGITSQEMGLFVEKVPGRKIPKKRMTTIHIPGRSEPLHQWDGSWEPYPQKYKCWFRSTPAESQIHNICKWLHGAPVPAKLSDTYDTTVFHKAAYVGGADVESLMQQIGMFTVEFEVGAQAYLNTGEAPWEVKSGLILNNQTPWPSYPLIEVTGSVSGLVRIGSESLTILFSGYNDVRTLYVDCEIREAWEIVDGVEISRNEWVSSQEFPVIRPGANVIETTGGITSARIKPRWYTL